MTNSLIPASRSLPAVLRAALQPPAMLRILVGTYDTTPSSDSRYANVILDGTPVTLPNLNAATGTAGAPAYILADTQGRMWVLGTVTGTGPVAGGPAFIAGTGTPSGAVGRDGDTYLDTTSLRLYSPKSGGAWPSAIGRIMPLTPTYAQLKAG